MNDALDDLMKRIRAIEANLEDLYIKERMSDEKYEVLIDKVKEFNSRVKVAVPATIKSGSVGADFNRLSTEFGLFKSAVERKIGGLEMAAGKVSSRTGLLEKAAPDGMLNLNRLSSDFGIFRAAIERKLSYFDSVASEISGKLRGIENKKPADLENLKRLSLELAGVRSDFEKRLMQIEKESFGKIRPEFAAGLTRVSSDLHGLRRDMEKKFAVIEESSRETNRHIAGIERVKSDASKINRVSTGFGMFKDEIGRKINALSASLDSFKKETGSEFSVKLNSSLDELEKALRLKIAEQGAMAATRADFDELSNQIHNLRNQAKVVEKSRMDIRRIDMELLNLKEQAVAFGSVKDSEMLQKEIDDLRVEMKAILEEAVELRRHVKFLRAGLSEDAAIIRSFREEEARLSNVQEQVRKKVGRIGEEVYAMKNEIIDKPLKFKEKASNGPSDYDEDIKIFRQFAEVINSYITAGKFDKAALSYDYMIGIYNRLMSGGLPSNEKRDLNALMKEYNSLIKSGVLVE